MPERVSGLLGLHERTADVYRALDWKLTARIGGVLWLIGAGAACAVLPFAAPTHLIGQAGWVVIAALAVASASAGVYLLVRAISPLHLLAMGYAAAAALGVGQAVIGPQARFELSLLLLAAYHSAVHPARRALPLLAWVAAAEAVSTLVDQPSALDVAEMVSTIVLITLIAVMALVFAESNRSLAAQLTTLRESAEHRALTDALTGLGNRRAFDGSLDRQVAGSQRARRPLSLAMLDLHHFKSINDRFGHEAGDAALVATAKAITDELRRADTCFRWGGDEFALVLPEVGLEQAEQVTRRVAEAVDRNTRAPSGQPLSIDSGVATLRPGESSAQLVARADSLLLAAKRPRRAAAGDRQTLVARQLVAGE